MIFKLLQARVIWAVALLVAAMLALVPSQASAHAGHSHGGQQPARTVTVHQQAPAPVAVVKVISVQMVSAVVTLPDPPADSTRCDGVGCCSSGPCTGCHGVMLTALPFEVLARSPDPVLARDARPPGGAEVDRLKRPPKLFA